jgi:hypothetical protein
MTSELPDRIQHCQHGFGVALVRSQVFATGVTLRPTTKESSNQMTELSCIIQQSATDFIKSGGWK